MTERRAPLTRTPPGGGRVSAASMPTFRLVTARDFSEASKTVVERERKAMIDRASELKRQLQVVQDLGSGIEAELRDVTRLVRQMDELLGDSPQLAIDHHDEELRGRRLREVAVELLRAKKGPGVEIHYRDWYEIVLDTGASVSGRNPVANFLTQISAAPEVESVRPRSGLFRLRDAA